MNLTMYTEWLSKAREITTKVKVTRERLLTLSQKSPKDYYAELQDYDLAGLAYTCDCLQCGPEQADKIIRTYGAMHRRTVINKYGREVEVIDLPLYPATGSIKAAIDDGRAITRGWYSVANALGKLTVEQERALHEIMRKVLDNNVTGDKI